MKKSILITGASGNLGKTVWQRLAAAEYHILAPVRSQKSVDAFQSKEVAATILNLTDEKAVRTYVQEVKENRNIVAAVMLAGGFSAGDLLSTDKDTLGKMFALNFETTFYLVRELIPVFEQNGGGRFIFIGSKAALEPEEGKNEVAYALSKQLVFQLAEIVNAHGKGKSIDATVIVPSTIDTLQNRQFMPNADFTKWVNPKAIADTIYFILSDAGLQIRNSILKLYNES